MTQPLHRTLADAVHIHDKPQRFYGLEVGARMTILELDGGLLLHAPLALPPEQLAHLGKPRWVLAPNKFHHLYVGPWIEAGLEAWAAAGLPEKRPDLSFQGTIEPQHNPFGSDIALLPLSCFPFTNEVVVLHKPSRTLIVTDLLFHFPSTAPLLTRAAIRCAGGYPGCRPTLLERFGIQRAKAQPEFQTIADWDFDRLVMAHGEVIETGGKDAFLRAFDWLFVG